MDIIIETPKGSTAKFDFNLEKGKLELGKVLPMGLAFPYDFGYIAGTKGEDGDPLDALIISEIQTFPGCLLNCRLIGGIKATQVGKDGKAVRNDRLLAIPEASIEYAKIKTMGQLTQQVKQQLLAFFENYNQQEGRVFKLTKWLSAKEANAVVKTSLLQPSDPTYLVQLFLPLIDDNAKPYPSSHFESTKKELVKVFGGISVFGQLPVAGTWENGKGEQEKDKLIVFEVMTSVIDKAYWKALRKSLEKKFAQELVVIRSLSIGLL